MSFEALLHTQPWRSGVGTPRNALDPTWDGYPRDFCSGEIDWEGTSSWWMCRACGYVSHGGYTIHKPVLHPGWFFMTSVLFFWMKKTQARCRPEDAMNQMLYVQAVALRQAAVQPPEQLENYVSRLVTV